MSRSVGRLPFVAAVVVGAVLSGNPALGDRTGQELWDLTENKIFNGQIHAIQVTMNQAVWNQLHDDEKNNGCRKGDDVKWAHVRSFVVDDVVLKNVAMRVRGNTSRCIPAFNSASPSTRPTRCSASKAWLRPSRSRRRKSRPLPPPGRLSHFLGLDAAARGDPGISHHAPRAAAPPLRAQEGRS